MRVAAQSVTGGERGEHREANGCREGGREREVCKSKNPRWVHVLIQPFLFWLSGQASSTFL